MSEYTYNVKSSFLPIFSFTPTSCIAYNASEFFILATIVNNVDYFPQYVYYDENGRFLSGIIWSDITVYDDEVGYFVMQLKRVD